MSDSSELGKIGWTDIAVDDAETLRDFYAQVVGWKSEAVAMDGYEDYAMNAPGSGEAAAGICHRRGASAETPSQWMVYINVADIDASAASCVELGGELIGPIRSYGGESRYCVFRDPAGAVAALFQKSGLPSAT